MAIHFSCPACGSSFSVNDELAGRTGRCSDCRERIQIPASPTRAAHPRRPPPIPPEPKSASSGSPTFNVNSFKSAAGAGVTLEQRPHLLVMGFGLFFWGTSLMTAFTQGMYDWTVMQALLFLFVAGWMPNLQGIPVVGWLQRDADKLVQKYREHPERIRGMQILLRIIPIANIWMMFKDARLLLPILIVGMPFDIALEALTRYVLPFPQWGAAANQTFAGVIFTELWMTFLAAPYLMLVGLWCRCLTGARAQFV